MKIFELFDEGLHIHWLQMA